MPSADTVTPPRRTRGDADVIELVGQCLVDIHLALAVQLHIGEALDLTDAVVDDSAPRRKAGQRRFSGHPPAEGTSGLNGNNLAPTLAERLSRLEAGRAGADDQHTPTLCLPIRSPGASLAAIPRPSTGSACSGWGRSTRRRSHRCCSRCTRGCPPGDLLRSSSAGTGRQWTAVLRRSCPGRRCVICRSHQVGRGEAADADDRLAS